MLHIPYLQLILNYIKSGLKLTVTDWRSHPLHCHHPNYPPRHVHLRLHLNQPSLKTETDVISHILFP